MAKRATPAFLTGIADKINAAKSAKASTRVAQAIKKSDKKRAKEKDRVKRRKEEKVAKRSMSVSVPAYVKLVGFDSTTWKVAAECDSILKNPWKGDGWTLGDAVKAARGMAQGHWGATPSAREEWAKDKSPAQVRDALFNAIPAGPIKDFERKYYEKWGDYRKLGWSEWASVLWEMYSPRTFAPDQDLWQTAKDFVLWELSTSRGQFADEYIEPILDMDEALGIVTVDKNSGMPFCTSKWFEDKDVTEFYLNMAGAMCDGEFPHDYIARVFGVDAETAKIHTAAVLFNRRQPNGGIDDNMSPTRPDGKPSVKMRAVECPIKSDAIAGKLFIDPMLNRMREIPTYSGLNGADNIGRYVHNLLTSYPNAMEGDFSQFDAGVQRQMMHEVMIEIVARLFSGHFLPYFKMIAEWYTTMWVITPNGVTTGEHGLLSGCAWTSVIGSITNRLTTVYSLLKAGVDVTCPDTVEHLAFGDDIALFTHVPLDLNYFEEAMSECGMECNHTKQEQSQGDGRFVTFLGYRHYANIPPSEDWTVDYIGVFPIMRTQTFFRERYTDNLDGVCADMGITPATFDIMRYICKLENLRNHPNRMDALNVLLAEGLPLQHVTYDGPVPDTLRVGRRSKGVLFSDHWLVKDVTLEG